VHPEVVRRLAARGDLVRISRGLYALPNAEATEHHTLATVSTRVPAAVICRLSALDSRPWHQEAIVGIYGERPRHAARTFVPARSLCRRPIEPFIAPRSTIVYRCSIKNV
jgi:predicted transcriptional regulator of viral defense system